MYIILSLFLGYQLTNIIKILTFMRAFILKYLIRNLNLIISLLEMYTGDPRQWRNMCQHL